jgi:hypothetical protein
LFFELCGKDKKFITYSRLLQRYKDYRSNKSTISLECKQFFSYINDIILDQHDAVGSNANCVTVSSEVHRHRLFISHIKVFENTKEVLTGMSIEYEEGISTDLQHNENDIIKIDLELKVRNEFTCFLEPKEYEDIDENYFRDNITHIFGTFSNRLEFIGFKCSSGRLYYTGNPNRGHTFLFGAFKSNLHTIKLGLNKGIRYLKVSFKESKVYNKSFDTNNIDHITDSLLDEEEIIAKLVSKKDKEVNILFPYLDDSYLYIDGDEIGQSYFGFFNHISINNEECSNYDHFYKFLIQTELKEEKEKLKTAKFRRDSLMKLQEIMKVKENEKEKEIEKEKSKKPNKLYMDILKKSKLWNKVSIQTLNKEDLIYNDKTLNDFIDKYIEEIRLQIFKLKNRTKFASTFLIPYETTVQEPEVDINSIDEKFNKILNNQFKLTHAKNFKFLVYNTIETEKYETIGDDSFESGFSDNTFDRRNKTELIIKLWKKFSNHLFNQVSKVLFTGAFSTLKALDILQEAESGEDKTTFTLDEKLKTLDTLIRFRIHRKQLIKHLRDFVKKYRSEDEEKERKQIIVEKKILKTVEFRALRTEQCRKLQEDINNTRCELARKYEVGIERLRSLHEESLKNKLKTLMRGLKKDTNEIFKEMFKIKTKSYFDCDTPDHIKSFKNQEPSEEDDFTDYLFPPEKGSLCPYNHEQKLWEKPKYVSEADIKDWELFKWERADKFLDKTYEIFYQGIDVNDIIQGKIGNCYFQSAVAALTFFPQLVYRLFYFKDRTKNHQYGVFIRKKGVWELMIMDDYFPVFGKLKPRPAGCISQDRKELWVMLLEKAWSKMNGSYANAIGGEPSEVFDAITNATSESIFFNSMNLKKKEKLWKSLMTGKINNFIMTAGTNKNNDIDYASLGLEAGHAYTILSIDELEGHIRLVKLRNPWANLEWSGAWSDIDKENWTPERQDKLGHEFNGSDGIFYMEFNDFVKYFFNVSICKVYPNYVYGYLVYGSSEVGKPNITVINIETETKIFFQIHQNNPRFSKDFFAMSMTFIMLCDKDNNYIASASSNKSNTSIEVDLQPGYYYLYTDINYRFVKAREYGYNITTYSAEPVLMEKTDKINHITLLEDAIIDYSKKILKPITVEESKFYSDVKGVKLYMKAKSKKFPFIFSVVENEFDDIKAQVDFSLGEQKTLYNEHTDFREDNIKKIVNCGTTKVFIVMLHYYCTEADVVWDISCIPQNEQVLMNIVEKKGIENNFDVEGLLVEKTLMYKNGYVILLENNGDKDKVMGLVLKNLKWDKVNKEEKEIELEIKAESKMMIHLHVIDNKKEREYFFRI